ncbi:MAG: hypothetical protein HGA35_06240 [Erysipelotrichaceae bacterium]|nr:hypothetical protein [Erysipelotrichaceae bacterium]
MKIFEADLEKRYNEYLLKAKKLEERDAQRDKEYAAMQYEQKETALLSTMDKFVESNSITSKDFENTLNAMDADGLQYETLLALPLSAVSKLLSSYTTKETSKQKELAERARISKEIPMTPTEKTDGVAPDRVDDIFMYMSGQKRDF